MMEIKLDNNGKVKTIEWMLSHSGIAVAKAVGSDNNLVEIIKYTENKEDYEEFRVFAKKNGYLLVVGNKTEGIVNLL